MIITLLSILDIIFELKIGQITDKSSKNIANNTYYTVLSDVPRFVRVVVT